MKPRGLEWSGGGRRQATVPKVGAGFGEGDLGARSLDARGGLVEENLKPRCPRSVVGGRKGTSGHKASRLGVGGLPQITEPQGRGLREHFGDRGLDVEG
uniref:Uncharacterized protein n=1 Tax=Solanum lycopersicum TaxID=4081 RepID=A0A3Q7HLS1_SOLLC